MLRPRTFSLTSTTTFVLLTITVFLAHSIEPIYAAQFDFSHVWFQHTNQVLHLYDQLSHISTNMNRTVDGISAYECRLSMQQLVRDAHRNQYYANKSK